MNDLYTVSEVALKLNVSADTIRRWDKKGLIKGQRDAHNYRVFSLSEVERVKNKVGGEVSDFKILINPKKTDYTVIDLFSGAGGTALGLENAGFKHKLLVEWDKNAAQTLRNNNKNWEVIQDDVGRVNFSGMHSDVVEGGFPCQAFSYAGNRLGFEDIRGTLFFEFVKCVKQVQPKVAIGENVKGLLEHDRGRTLKTMIKALHEIGYKVAFKILKAQYFDVPQKRERLVIIAVRGDLDIPILFPIENNYIVSLREALKNVPISEGQKYPQRKREILDLVPEGGYWKDLPTEIQKEFMGASFYHTGGRTGMARRLAWDEPSLTLTTSPAQKQTERCHPSETRPLTVREYARIQTFPDEWVFAGSTNQQYKQIGNAVPVNLGYHIGNAVIAMLDGGEYDKSKFLEVKPLSKDYYTEVNNIELRLFSPDII